MTYDPNTTDKTDNTDGTNGTRPDRANTADRTSTADRTADTGTTGAERPTGPPATPEVRGGREVKRPVRTPESPSRGNADTATDRTSTGADRTSPGTDRTSPGTDRTASGTDRTSTGTDRTQSATSTGTDRSSTGTATRPSTGTSAGTATGTATGKAPTSGKADHTKARFFPQDESDKLNQRLQDALSSFVDGPRRSVEEAAGVLEETAERLSKVLAERPRSLRADWDTSGQDKDGGKDTEDLRLALQSYREVTERLLRI
ncbi:hypothetical protein ACIO1C_10745 [Streptomyces sp. NPDC087420]|uniref:hypothetical protein n=1 Tax=Streptomyces sp. NPDC087420 TaxID=3365785 RepID=UPI003837D24D